MFRRLALGSFVGALILLFGQSANADTISARLVVTAFTDPVGFPPTFPVVARLDALITLESADGPFWLPWYGSYIDGPGYLITSLDGVLHTSFNEEKDELATLAPIDPLKPWWGFVSSFNGSTSFLPMNLAWITPSGSGSAGFELSRHAIFISGQGCCFDGTASAVVVPEEPTLETLAMGLLLMVGVTARSFRRKE